MKQVIFFIAFLLCSTGMIFGESNSDWLLTDSTEESESSSESGSSSSSNSSSRSRSSKSKKSTTRTRTQNNNIGYDHFGVGGNISLVVPWRDVGFGFASGGHIEINLGRFGAAQYAPTIAYWFANDKSTKTENGWVTESKDHDAGLNLNFFDIAYLPPVPKTLPIRPYVGFGPTICVNFGRWEWAVYNPDGDVTSSGSGDWDDGAHGGFNMFLGTEFPIKSFTPYTEIRFTASRWRYIRVFRLTAGFNICF